MLTKNSFLIITLARNEELTISKILKESVKFSDVLVVNDASEDNTLNLIKKFPVKVITNKKPQGYSNSQRIGLKYALKKKYNYVILIDSDGEHSPALIKNFIDGFKNSEKIIFGKRRIQRLSEKIICKYYQYFYGVTDILCGMKAICMSEIKRELLDSKKDELGMTIILDILRNKKKFTEINVFGKDRNDKSRIYLNFYSRFKYLRLILNSLASDILFTIKK